jgi:hypothetical protein
MTKQLTEQKKSINLLISLDIHNKIWYTVFVIS